jgi:SAM-dependent methyltransferase
MNWARHGANVTAVDLNPVAIAQTRRRFEIYGLAGNIHEADAENLEFPDNTFDYVYSWGVLHHTPNIKQAINGLYRVLRPGGRVGVMLYHRNSVMYRFLMAYIEGFVNMERKFLSPLELASRYTDGDRAEGNPHTWPVTKREVRRDLFADFSHVRIDIFGTELVSIFNQWHPRLGKRLPRRLIEACMRRWGWSLWITGEKAT